jgi:hypothetical protein
MEPIALERWFRSSRANVNTKLLTLVSNRPLIESNFKKTSRPQSWDSPKGGQRDKPQPVIVVLVSEKRILPDHDEPPGNRFLAARRLRSHFCVLCEINSTYTEVVTESWDGYPNIDIFCGLGG